ncbi:MAG: hypothetical protein COT17_01865 [Elusimicrobia bacterium CG08_land_8_20_14_0_20_51_18]|nr:MAG: hypothetical protein COT17_01865 [Elusimicrobia bacterium CG08_land_8_20_14_0_20_51_18]
MLNDEAVKKIKPRLRRIEGQIRGVIKMAEKKEYCLDIFQQISAIEGALKGVNLMILENHLNTCVRRAMTGGGEEAVRSKIKELIEIYKKF